MVAPNTATTVALVPKLFDNIVGVYRPTPSLSRYVQASVGKLKDENVHRLFDTHPTKVEFLDLIVRDSFPYLLIPHE